MRTLVLMPDAFGGRGGIAKFNRDFLHALCTYRDSTEVLAFPRRVVDPVGVLPKKLNYVAGVPKGKLSFAVAVWQAVNRNPKFDLIVCGHIGLLPLAYLVAVRTRSPVYLILHGVEVWEPSYSWLGNRLLNRIDGIISVSEYTKKRLFGWAKLGRIKEFILPNTVNLKDFQPGAKNPELVQRYGLEGKKVLMTLGRLDTKERYKGFDEILKILPALLKEIPDLVYTIVGEGDDRTRLEALAQSLGVLENVLFTGFIPEAEKADHYRLADAFAMPGKGEGFGIVYLEAIACGVPTVASKFDGSREALRDGLLGILVDPYDLEDIKKGILSALQGDKGVVPKGLEYFSSERFETRCHQICDRLRFNPKQDSWRNDVKKA